MIKIINKRVRVVRDACGDLPRSLMLRSGIVISRNKSHDERIDGEFVKAYNVKFSGWKNPKVLWADEIEVL